MNTDTSYRHRWNLADTVTALRMAASVGLLFLPLRSGWFLGVYSFAGITDAADGFLARKTGTASEFGGRLDSAADLLFFGVLLLRLLPLLLVRMSGEIWWMVAGIILVRLVCYGVMLLRFRSFAPLHTLLNKLTGALVFVLPYVLAVSDGTRYCRIVCVVALAAALEELVRQLRPQ